MKKTFIILILVLLFVVLFTACDKKETKVEPVYDYDGAYVYVAGEWKEITVRSWRDLGNGLLEIYTGNDTSENSEDTPYIFSVETIPLLDEQGNSLGAKGFTVIYSNQVIIDKTNCVLFKKSQFTHLFGE